MSNTPEKKTHWFKKAARTTGNAVAFAGTVMVTGVVAGFIIIKVDSLLTPK